MIINKIKNTNSYEIKLLEKHINIYNKKEIEEITKKIINKINKKSKLKKAIILEFYLNKKYGTIIILKELNKTIPQNNETEVKIIIHTDTIFLYKIDYFNIQNNKNIYYYQGNFYTEIKETINKKNYLDILENSEIVYEDSYNIIDKGIKI